ncbi:cytochrome c peroxidase [Gelidibacter algens]|uniref:Cytochrome c peroxidase n=1 Tax=Gelidibacter algens TaxID=49280 RepID=A0A1A7R3L0_9FLAO|nr:cytochrome c peroxidase [Gelidibacter algens]OBX25362.1 cytochrome-c peroxidase [Gelidibacter algens]RAJ25167.1 cytochrome c peroxidase [Gelidibacter algens]
MKHFSSPLLVLFSFALFLSCKKEKEELVPISEWTYAQNYYLENITKSIQYLDSLKVEGFDGKNAKNLFKEARIAFKKAEPYATYLNPDVGHRANGPALPIFKEDNNKVLKPVGFQKIEESIYEGETSKADYEEELYITKGLLINLQSNIEKRELNPQRFFIATHQQLFRIVSLAIAGFDTPVSHLGISETAISLESLYEIYQHSIQYIIKDKNSKLDTDFQNHIEKAVKFIEDNPDFDTFDRYTFTREYFNPIMRNWVDIRKTSDLWEPVDTEPFNFDAPTFFEKNAFNSNFFMPNVNKNPTDKQIELGKKLFFDTNLSANGLMACATCHNPDKAYADGMAANSDNNGKPLGRNTPTLINSAFQQSFFWDGRSETILDQISSVFTNKDEFNTNVHEFSSEILKDSTYNKLFKDAFGSISTRNTDVIKAISSYVSELNGFNSKFDQNMRAEVDTYTDEEKLGYNLFMGKALCATCHFIPLTNGTVPPFFGETEKEVIGVPETATNKSLDDDLGFYWKYGSPLHKGMFKTVTVRNSALTAPYMHNGVYETLEEVLNFYNLGGGGGMGFELEHQTLPFDELNLTESEQKAIIAFLKTLNDTDVESY